MRKSASHVILMFTSRQCEQIAPPVALHVVADCVMQIVQFALVWVFACKPQGDVFHQWLVLIGIAEKHSHMNFPRFWLCSAIRQLG